MEELKSSETECIDAKKTALVVIDLQNGIVNMPNKAPHTGEQVVQKGSSLVQAFTEKGHLLYLLEYHR